MAALRPERGTRLVLDGAMPGMHRPARDALRADHPVYCGGLSAFRPSARP